MSFSFFDNTKYINWLEAKNILLLLSIVLIACVVLILCLPNKSKKGITITKLVISFTLLILEIGRILWWYFRCKHYGDTFDFFKRFNFEMCSMMVWLNIFTVILSLFVSKDNKLFTYLCNVTFGIGMIGGLITFAYPAFIDSYYHILHFRNLQSIITHILLIVTPIYLLKTKHFTITLKNYWVIPFSLVCVGSVSSFAAICSGWNFAYVFYCAPFNLMGINIPFPFHILIIMLLISSVQFLLYTIVEIIKHKKKKIPYSTIGVFEILAYVITEIYTVIHLILLNALSIYTPSYHGIFMLIPFVIAISVITLLYLVLKKYKKI